MNDENKNPEEQETEVTPAEETAAEENTAAAETEAAEDIETAKNTETEPEEAAAEASETQEVVFEGETVAVEPEEEPKKSNTKLIAGIAAAVVVVAAAIVAFIIFGKNIFNPYTKDYIDVTGTTVGEIADQQGMEYADFLELYGLPSDMPASTSENAAYYNIPAGVFAQMSGTDFDELKEILGLTDDDSITEETTIGDVFDKTTVGSRVGEDQLDAFKAEYGLDDSVTADTLWGEIRNKVDQKLKEQNEAAKNPVEETDEPEDASENAEAAEDAEEATQAAE
ncbi:MAG: hypothetical protein ACI4DP_00550 [Candidatus Ornithomonoglobus sp.]